MKTLRWFSIALVALYVLIRLELREKWLAI